MAEIFTYRLAFCKSRRSAEQTTFTSPRTMYLPREILIITFLSESCTLDCAKLKNRAGQTIFAYYVRLVLRNEHLIRYVFGQSINRVYYEV